MKKYYSLFIALLFIMCTAKAQSIRKNYQEMTSSEKTALVNAFYQMRLGADLVNDLAEFHRNFFQLGPTELDIHFNHNQPEIQIFFSWHRMQMFEMEQAMQNIDPTISMPWWDSSVDNSFTSPLWDLDFMGGFNADWNLGRNLGGNGPLPTPEVITAVQSLTDFLDYSNQVERGATHRGAHVWVGGVMPTARSPRDPIFYLHHTFVDKLWDDWERANPGGSSFIITSMIRYDGTYTFDGVTLPLVDPDDIVDSRALGVFYAENQLADLSGYTVSNTYKPIETFYYQYLIKLGNSFTVPSGKNCRVESVNEIKLMPGFEAVAGSSFVAQIDTPNAANARNAPNAPNAYDTLIIPNSSIVRNQTPFENEDLILDQNAYDPQEFLADGIEIDVFPNPFVNTITIAMNQRVKENLIYIYDLSGILVVQKNIKNSSYLEITDLMNLKKGIYILELIADGQNVLRKKLMKN